MIFADQSEIDHYNSAVSKVKEQIFFKESPVLEQFTGADIMISPLSIPATTEVLIQKHIDAGAFLIQIKQGEDLMNSIGERLSSSLAKMIDTKAKTPQRVLLFIGRIDHNANGKCTINNLEQIGSRMSLAGAIAKWQSRGGCWESLEDISLLADWITMKEKHVIEFANNPTKEVYPVLDYSEPDMSDMLQTVILVKDWRKTIATFPNIGPTRANAIREFVLNEKRKDILLAGLFALIDEDTKIAGIGDIIKNKCREYLIGPDHKGLEMVLMFKRTDWEEKHNLRMNAEEFTSPTASTSIKDKPTDELLDMIGGK